MVVREAEWDDTERDKMLDLTEYEAKVCECGFHESVADQDPDLELALRRCPVCAGIAQQMRVLDEQDTRDLKAMGERVPAAAERPDDGRRVALRFKPPTEPDPTTR